MSQSEIEVLSRAHRMFAGSGRHPALDTDTSHYGSLLQRTGELNTLASLPRYQHAARRGQTALRAAAHTDAEAAAVIVCAQRDRAEAHELTRRVLDAARADVVATPLAPLAWREAMRRRAARLRAQRAHVLAARRRARRRLVALRALHYRMPHHRRHRLLGLRLPAADSRATAAVRAALSRLGRPYVWGATGPNQFDCSGLVQWSYAQAGVHVDRTTYQQIHDGIPVPLSQVRPGDLVFPHPGHVQLAIGNNLVVEAPYSGASVRISRLGSNVAIRRPM
ncbi:C40 family peptidase [Mycobacterium spongiae]|uniref:NlpC/P60 family protein n=1 Tax=Mycobacterium spongiae TaxID=886343 RepID=A0A975PV64_9MYCO|nr:C40 family peptidase [Mycobacterium spongiae]QUR65697.1 NlpC/P60 family protein [Mycobacterium spongiae]